MCTVTILTQYSAGSSSHCSEIKGREERREGGKDVEESVGEMEGCREEEKLNIYMLEWNK